MKSLFWPFATIALALGALRSLRYELRDEGLCVVILGVCVRRIEYSDIADVRRGYVWWNEHYNRLALDPNITIVRKTGAIKNFVINPPQTDEFMRELRERAGLI
jgi:hypothetical protein